MQKIKLNLEPNDRITFVSDVAIPTPDGKALKVSFDFRHRTREQMAKLLDTYLAKAREVAADAAAKVEDDEGTTLLADNVAELIARDVEAVMDVASGWYVEDHPYSAASLSKFFNLYPGAATAIVQHYRVSLLQGRLGN